MIEEEIYSDDDKSSVYTSEDDFNDTETMPAVWCKEFPLKKGNNDDFFEQEEEYQGDAKTQQWQAAWPSYMRNTTVTKAAEEPPKREVVHQFSQKVADQRVAKFEGLEYIEAKRKKEQKNNKTKAKLLK